jgi:hypothetical protein
MWRSAQIFFFVAFKAKGEKDSFGVPKPKAVTII